MPKATDALNVLNKEQKEERKDFETRRGALIKELNPLLKKYKINVGAGLDYRGEAIVAVPTFIDAKEAYERLEKEKVQETHLEV